MSRESKAKLEKTFYRKYGHKVPEDTPKKKEEANVPRHVRAITEKMKTDDTHYYVK